MVQIACKLPSEAKLRIVNWDLGRSFFMAKGRIQFFCGSGEKLRFPSHCPETLIYVFLKNFLQQIKTVQIFQFEICFPTINNKNKIK